MNLPIQSNPVLRMIATASCETVDMARGGGPSNGIAPCEYGIEPSFGWRDALDIATKIAPIVLAAV